MVWNNRRYRMKRPDKLVEWFRIEELNSRWVDWNGNPIKEYIVKIPYWIGRAYSRGRLPFVQICFYDKSISAKDRDKMSTDDLTMKYFKENFSKKITKMRKLNNNYMSVRPGKKNDMD